MYNKIEREVQRFPIYPCPDAQLPPSSATTARVVQLLVTIDEPTLTSHHHTGSTVCLRTPFLYHTVYGFNVLVAQSCPTLYNPMDCSPPGSSVHAILQARILEWVAIPFSRGSSWQDRTQASCTAGRFFTIWARMGLTNVQLYHYTTIQNIFNSLKILCVPSIHPSPFPLPIIDLFIIFIVLSFPICHIVGIL